MAKLGPFWSIFGHFKSPFVILKQVIYWPQIRRFTTLCDADIGRRSSLSLLWIEFILLLCNALLPSLKCKNRSRNEEAKLHLTSQSFAIHSYFSTVTFCNISRIPIWIYIIEWFSRFRRFWNNHANLYNCVNFNNCDDSSDFVDSDWFARFQSISLISLISLISSILSILLILLISSILSMLSISLIFVNLLLKNKK